MRDVVLAFDLDCVLVLLFLWSSANTQDEAISARKCRGLLQHGVDAHKGYEGEVWSQGAIALWQAEKESTEKKALKTRKHVSYNKQKAHKNSEKKSR